MTAEIYQPKVVGMMWSMLAQLQTWFGKEPWKSYGIQLLPITVVSGARDDVPWMREMLPAYNESCMSDQGKRGESPPSPLAFSTEDASL